MRGLIIILFLIAYQVAFSQSYKDNFNRSITPDKRKSLKQEIYNFSQQINANKTNAQLYLNRGEVYTQLGYHPDAISDYNRALKIDSTLAKAYYNRGVAKARFRYTKRSCIDVKKAYDLGLDYAKKAYNKHCGIYVSQLGKIE